MPTQRKASQPLTDFLYLLIAHGHVSLDNMRSLLQTATEGVEIDSRLKRYFQDAALQLTPPTAGQVAATQKARDTQG